jgi:transcriptional regulator with XRE-family HTH domain
VKETISLSELLTRFRDIIECSQKEVAEAVDIPAPSLSFYENGQRTPPYKTLVNLLEYYDAQMLIETDLGKWVWAEVNGEPQLIEMAKKEEIGLLSGLPEDEKEDLIAYIRRRRQHHEEKSGQE